MKRMTLLTSLVMVFSLLTATVAFAGPGDSGPAGETVMTQTQEGEHDGDCVGTDTECEPVQERTQTRAQTQERELDGDCVGTDTECEPVQERTQTRTEAQVRNDEGACAGTDTECEAELDRDRLRDQDMTRAANGACAGTDTECEAELDRDRLRDQDMTRAADGTCAGTDAECAAERAMVQTEERNQVMERIAAVIGDSEGGGYLFAMVRWMLAHMYGPLSALFL